MLDSVVSLLSDAIKYIGGILIVLGLVNIGLTLKDGVGGGNGLSGGVTMVVGGALIVAFARLFGG